MARRRNLATRLELPEVEKSKKARYPQKDTIDYTLQLPLVLYVGLVRISQKEYRSMASVVKAWIAERLAQAVTLEDLLTAADLIPVSEDDKTRIREQWLLVKGNVSEPTSITAASDCLETP